MSWGERSCKWMYFQEEVMGPKKPCKPTMATCNVGCEHYKYYIPAKELRKAVVSTEPKTVKIEDIRKEEQGRAGHDTTSHEEQRADSNKVSGVR